MPTWLAIVIVAIIGPLLVYWHFSGTQVMAISHKGKNGAHPAGGDGGGWDGCDGGGGGGGGGGGD